MNIEVFNLIIKKYSLNTEEYLTSHKKITIGTLLKALLDGRKHSDLNISFSSYTTYNKKLLKLCGIQKHAGSKISILSLILHSIGCKKCGGCYKILDIDNYYVSNNPNSWDKLNSICKKCSSIQHKTWSEVNNCRFREIKREFYYSNKEIYIQYALKKRQHIKQVTPSWADTLKINDIYNNCPEGYHVDHIIPLNGKLVSGLHVENNLQYLLAEDNIRKSNKFSID